MFFNSYALILRRSVCILNKNYQNVNSKRLQLTTVYFLTLNDHLACAISDFAITSDSMDTSTKNDQLNTTVAPVG
jgi:hypothetical protein